MIITSWDMNIITINFINGPTLLHIFIWLIFMMYGSNYLFVFFFIILYKLSK